MTKKIKRLIKEAHANQMWGNKPYVYHLYKTEKLIIENLDPNLNLQYARNVALLHDILEDTNIQYDDIKRMFGKKVADGVKALTKNKRLPKIQQLSDSVKRIKKESPEIAAVKLADRISNLSQPFPKHWTKLNRKNYIKSSDYLLDELGFSSRKLANIMIYHLEKYGVKFF